MSPALLLLLMLQWPTVLMSLLLIFSSLAADAAVACWHGFFPTNREERQLVYSSVSLLPFCICS
jgi:hypothetical protein